MFLAAPMPSPDAQRLFDADVAERGYVMNASRLWAYLADTHDGLFDLMGEAARSAALTVRQRGVLISACASAMGDAYCSLAWGARLAAEAGDEVAAGVLRGTDVGLDVAEKALARWARRVAHDPNGTGPADVQDLRDVGYDDRQIFAITVFVALRVAFSTVNDALGAPPDSRLDELAPGRVREAVRYGRPVGDDGPPDAGRN
jgi:alkylhydroperoxidase family enzyme